MALGFLGESAAAGAVKKMNKEQLAAIAAYSQAAMKNAAPYMKLGQQAADAYALALPKLTDTKQYKEFTQPYTMEQYKQSPLYTPMVTNLAELQATPGYQFQLEQGLQAQQQGAAARGGLLSGAQQQALQRYGQGLASTGFQSAWERAQNAYKSAFEQRQQRGQMLADVNRQAAGIYSNATGIGNQASQAFNSLGKSLLDNTLDVQQQTGMANAVQAAAPYKGASSAIGLGTSLLGGLMGGGGGGLGSMFGMGTGTPGVGSPTYDEWAASPGQQALGAFPSSSQSVWSLQNGSPFQW